MCIVIYKPKDKVIPEEHLRESWNRNSDGAGYAFQDSNGIRVKKGFMKYKSFIKSYREDITIHNVPFLVHFRIATNGPISPENCHPFRVNNKTVMAHNGIISQYNYLHIDNSDSRDFTKYVLKPLSRMNRNFINYDVAKEMLEDYLTKYNLVVIMGIDEKVMILNEQWGEWENGIWYSNSSYKKYVIGKWIKKVNKNITECEQDEDDDKNDTARVGSTASNNAIEYQGEKCEWCGDDLSDMSELRMGCCSICMPEYIKYKQELAIENAIKNNIKQK